MDESFLNAYLEKRGLKYVVPFSALSYILGTLIFNTYFYNLGITEFDLLKLRYMLVGVVFVCCTALLAAGVYGIKAIFFRFTAKTELTKHKKIRLLEIILLIIFVPWTIAYSLHVFPMIPSAFGGAKPSLVRLIGEIDTIKQLNEMIAFETGIDPDTLPLEKLSENSNLAVGSNVKILDRNSSRVVIVLTKDLYLSTTSSVAKKLLDSGAVETFDDDDYDSDFTTKPIIFSAANIRGTTATLYQPSTVTTKADIEIVTQVLTEEPEKAAKVQAAISEDLKEAAPKLVQAVQKKVAEKKSAPVSNQTQAEKTEEVVQELLAETIIDTKFISFRGALFQVINLAYIQQKTGDRSLASRQRVAKSFAENFEKTYPSVWMKFSGNGNFLITGQGSDDYFLRLQRIVQGATTAEIIMERLNAERVQIGPDFSDIKTGVLELLTKSSAENTATNRKYVNEVLQRYLRQKAPQMTIYWLDNGYLVQGASSEKFLENVRTIFVESSSWEDLSTQMKNALADMSAVVATDKSTETIEEKKPEEPVADPEEPVSESETTETTEPVTEEPMIDEIASAEAEPTISTEPVTEETETQKNSAPIDEPKVDGTVEEENSAPVEEATPVDESGGVSLKE
jgi:hypothetical protein